MMAGTKPVARGRTRVGDHRRAAPHRVRIGRGPAAPRPRAKATDPIPGFAADEPRRHSGGTLSPAPPAVFRALQHRNYRLFFLGQLVSLIGTWMQSVAQSWLVYRLTGSAVLLGTVGFASQIPVFLLSPLGGVVADRRDRRRVLLATQ